MNLISQKSSGYSKSLNLEAEKHSRVCFIAPHFGQLPSWISLTFSTFSRNTSFDLLVVTDQDVKDFPEYPNIFFSFQTLKSFEYLCSKAVGTKVNVKKGYKVCDLRPAFGLIFANAVKNYDYWGHIDLDTFWGDLEKVLNPILQEDYDIICGYPYHVGGPFCLYKNTDFVNKLFQLNPNYVYAFECEENVDFDEIGINRIQYRGFDWTVRLLEEQRKLKVYRDRQLYLQDWNSSWWIQESRKAVSNAGLQEYPTDSHSFQFGTGSWTMGKITGLNEESREEYAFYHFLDGKRRLFQPFMISDCHQIKSFTVGLDGINLNYFFGISWVRHEFENMIVKILKIIVYDLGPLRNKLNFRRKRQ